MSSTAPHPFTIANYRYLWFSRLASMFALYAMMLILGWQAYNLAREDMGISASAGILGLLGLLQFVPLFILTPLVGWVADHMDRRWIARIVLALPGVPRTSGQFTGAQSGTKGFDPPRHRTFYHRVAGWRDRRPGHGGATLQG